MINFLTFIIKCVASVFLLIVCILLLVVSFIMWDFYYMEAGYIIVDKLWGANEG